MIRFNTTISRFCFYDQYSLRLGNSKKGYQILIFPNEDLYFFFKSIYYHYFTAGNFNSKKSTIGQSLKGINLVLVYKGLMKTSLRPALVHGTSI